MPSHQSASFDAVFRNRDQKNITNNSSSKGKRISGEPCLDNKERDLGMFAEAVPSDSYSRRKKMRSLLLRILLFGSFRKTMATRTSPPTEKTVDKKTRGRVPSKLSRSKLILLITKSFFSSNYTRLQDETHKNDYGYVGDGEDDTACTVYEATSQTSSLVEIASTSSTRDDTSCTVYEVASQTSSLVEIASTSSTRDDTSCTVYEAPSQVSSLVEVASASSSAVVEMTSSSSKLDAASTTIDPVPTHLAVAPLFSGNTAMKTTVVQRLTAPTTKLQLVLSHMVVLNDLNDLMSSPTSSCSERTTSGCDMTSYPHLTTRERNWTRFQRMIRVKCRLLRFLEARDYCIHQQNQTPSRPGTKMELKTSLQTEKDSFMEDYRLSAQDLECMIQHLVLCTKLQTSTLSSSSSPVAASGFQGDGNGTTTSSSKSRSSTSTSTIRWDLIEARIFSESWLVGLDGILRGTSMIHLKEITIKQCIAEFVATHYPEVTTTMTTTTTPNDPVSPRPSLPHGHHHHHHHHSVLSKQTSSCGSPRVVIVPGRRIREEHSHDKVNATHYSVDDCYSVASSLTNE